MISNSLARPIIRFQLRVSQVQTSEIMQIIANEIQRVVVQGITPAVALKAAAAEIASQVKS